jgi:hypothetical protein
MNYSCDLHVTYTQLLASVSLADVYTLMDAALISKYYTFATLQIRILKRIKYTDDITQNATGDEHRSLNQMSWCPRDKRTLTVICAHCPAGKYCELRDRYTVGRDKMALEPNGNEVSYEIVTATEPASVAVHWLRTLRTAVYSKILHATGCVCSVFT